MRSRHGDRRFDSLAEIRRYVAVLLAQDWFRKRWPQPIRIRVMDGRGITYACCESRNGCDFIFRLPRKKRTEYYVLHETAHACTWDEASWHHSLIFRQALVVLVRRRKGHKAATDLAREWQRAGFAI